MRGFRNIGVCLYRIEPQKLIRGVPVHLARDRSELLDGARSRQRTLVGVQIIAVGADENRHVTGAMAASSALFSPTVK